MDRLFWSRHANPWSVWTLVAAYPTLILAVYRRNRPLLVGTLLFVGMNPLVFAPPETDEAWATRVVLGEQVWIEQGIGSSTHTLFTAAAAPVYLFTVRSAVKRQPLSTTLGIVASMGLMFLFFRRMVALYDDQRGPGTTVPVDD